MKEIKRFLPVVLSGFCVALGLFAWFTYVNLAEIKRWVKGVEIVRVSSAVLGVRDLGKGSPVIVLVNGVGVPMTAYWEMQDTLSKHTRVIAYDRPGVGYSIENGEAKTLDKMERDLHNLLSEMEVPRPYILVGHSFGGHITRHYAKRYPDDVAGLVFLDAPHEGWLDYIRKTWPEDLVEPYFSFWRAENPNIKGGRRQEILAYEKNSALLKGHQISPDIPVLMFTGNNSGHFRKEKEAYLLDRQAWADMQADMIKGVKDADHIVDWEAGHWFHKDKPEMVNTRIAEFVAHVSSITKDAR